jgi:hypothetical protein
LDSLLIINKEVDMKLEEAKMKTTICTTFVFCYVWAIGGNLNPKDFDAFDTFVRNQFEENAEAKVSIYYFLRLQNVNLTEFCFSYQLEEIYSVIMLMFHTEEWNLGKKLYRNLLTIKRRLTLKC